MAYWLSRSIRLKNCVLLAASLFFYALGEPVYIVIMLTAAGSAFFFAFLIDKYRGTRVSKLLLAISVIISVSFLFYFKYVPLFVETAIRLLNLDIWPQFMRLPIGISFYTFQILTYTIDVYRGKTKLQSSAINFFLYVSLFPQLQAGPIVRYDDVAGQLERRYINAERFASGVVRFTCGLAKKVLIADYAGDIVKKLLSVPADGVWDISTPGAWLGLLLFGFQIYFDFSGYSDMAIGLGRMFGFEFLENFKYPYSSKSITEFWRRWHISLGMFFRDYVYIPLGGNRRRQIRNIAVVWMLTGFWHGANWNFVLWGCYFGIILIAEKYLSKMIRIKIPAYVGWAGSYLIVTVSWAIFYFSDLSAAWTVISAMFTYKPERDFQAVNLIKDNLFFVVICLFASMPWAKRLYERAVYWGERRNGRVTAILDASLSLVYAAALLLVCSAVRVGSSFSPIMYFRF